MKYVYVILSSTPTLVGKTLRTLSRKSLNHASISLDKDMNEMYAFARKRLHTPFVGGFVKENYNRLSIGGKYNVFVKIYEIPVTENQFSKIQSYIYNVRDDEETYLYNLFAIIGYPFHKGYNIYKAYICSEFVIRALMAGDVHFNSYTSFRLQPQDICALIYQNKIFEGNLRIYIDSVKHLNDNDDFFDRDRFTQSISKTVGVISKLTYRSIKKL